MVIYPAKKLFILIGLSEKFKLLSAYKIVLSNSQLKNGIGI